MDTDLPLLDQDRIARAAEGMIFNHGKDALAEADRRAQALRYSGCDAAAGNWERICEILKVHKFVLAVKGSVPHCFHWPGNQLQGELFIGQPFS